jgi:hypothetical protein
MTLLARVVRKLNDASIPSALIGGVALAVHGIGRATQDADLLTVDPDTLRDGFWEDLRREGVIVVVTRGDMEDPLRGVVRIRESAEIVDVVVGKSPWHQDVLRRRSTLPLLDEQLPVVDAADLVLLKLDAGGPQDLLDVRLLLRGPEGEGIRRTLATRLEGLPASLREALQALPKGP